MKNHDIRSICRQAVFLQSTAISAVSFVTTLPPEAVVVSCDDRQIAQALTNLLKNAVEAIEGRNDNTIKGEVALRIEQSQDEVKILIEDNGKGLPTEERHRLTEPYVTTRAKGTGLGLAIVKKIAEDHNGSLWLEDRDDGVIGARVKMILPKINIYPLANENEGGTNTETSV